MGNAEASGAKGSVWDNERLLSSIMITPAVLYITVLVGFPFVLAILYSLSDATTGDPSLDFVGLRNFVAVIKDPVFRKSLGNTFIFTFVSQALVIVLSKILALALLQEFRGKRIVRFLILLPWTAPIALGTIGWLWMLDSIFSPIDWVLRYAGLLGSPDALMGSNSNLYWLGVPSLAMLSVILVHTWRMLPLATVILLGGLTSIPNITVVYVLTQGGPFHSTQVLASWAFFKGIEAGDLAQGAAIALFLFPVMAAAAVLILRFVRRTEIT